MTFYRTLLSLLVVGLVTATLVGDEPADKPTQPAMSVEIILGELFGSEHPASTDKADKAVEAFCHRLLRQLRERDPQAQLPNGREARRKLWLNRLLGEIRNDVRDTYGAAGLEEFNQSK